MTQDRDYFLELPDEMVIQILLLLDFDSMLSARLCCTRFDSLLTGSFEDRSRINLDRWKNFKLAGDNPEHNWVFKTNKKLRNLKFNEINFDDANNNDIDKFWNLHGGSVIDLQMSYCTMAEETLHKIIDKVVNLKFFKLGLSRDIDGAKIIKKLYNRCVGITFTSTTFIDKSVIETIPTDQKTTIEELNLEYARCHEGGDRDHDIVFRDTGIYKLLVLIHENLKRFELFATNGDENILRELSRMNMNLETFKIYFHDEIDDSTMLSLTNKMKNLRKLNINGTLFSDDNANIIYDNLHELRSLTFQECDLLGNNGIINVTKLKKLEEFTVNTCQNVTNRGIINGIASKKNHTLKRLELYERFSDDTLIAIVNNLPNLETLQMFTILFFSPHLIPLIYERLVNLKEFCISSLNSPEDAEMFGEVEVAKNLPEPKLRNPDVKISNLSKLLVLQIYGFEKLPGATLLDIAQLPNLRNLTLQNYEMITKSDMIHLLKTTKSLRIVDFRHCIGIFENEADRAEIRAAKNSKTDFNFNFEKF